MHESQTPSDETGARAERLATIRRDVGRYDSIHLPANLDISFLLHELDRVTAQRETLQIYYENANAALSDAIASRNAWAEKAAYLKSESNNHREAAGRLGQALREVEQKGAYLLAIERAAEMAEAYEPECESCPRGVANAIRGLKTEQA